MVDRLFNGSGEVTCYLSYGGIATPENVGVGGFQESQDCTMLINACVAVAHKSLGATDSTLPLELAPLTAAMPLAVHARSVLNLITW